MPSTVKIVVATCLLAAVPAAFAVDGAFCTNWCVNEWVNCLNTHGGASGPGAGVAHHVCDPQLADCLDLCARLVTATNQLAAPPGGGAGTGPQLDLFLQNIATVDAGPALPAVGPWGADAAPFRAAAMPTVRPLLPRAATPRRSLRKHGR